MTRVAINGRDLALMVRGSSVDNPVLLFLAGGPGGSQLGAMRMHSRALEDHFVVVTLDQRGTGKSYDQLDTCLHTDRRCCRRRRRRHHEYLIDRFDQDQVYLLGQSWGSLLRCLAAQREPQLFRAFIGVGQMVSPAETDKVFYRDTLASARDAQHRAGRGTAQQRATAVLQRARLRGRPVL